jgi:hypothetical protein
MCSVNGFAVWAALEPAPAASDKSLARLNFADPPGIALH